MWESAYSLQPRGQRPQNEVRADCCHATGSEVKFCRIDSFRAFSSAVVRRP
jgi:hypothetical protein